MSSDSTFTLQTIGIVHSCYTEKFGIPRQPGLVTEAVARLELTSPYNRLDTLDGLEGFSHIWIQFIFHACLSENWKAKVRPPRLGGKVKMGVFATRSTHRPNPIGLSVVKIGRIYEEDKKVFIDLHGADLLDGTPVLDIKPYLPYSDCVENATGGFAPEAAQTKQVRFSELALSKCQHYENLHNREIGTLIKQIVEQDPRPSYLTHQTGKVHGITLWNLNIKWCARIDHLEILDIESLQDKST